MLIWSQIHTQLKPLGTNAMKKLCEGSWGLIYMYRNVITQNQWQACFQLLMLLLVAIVPSKQWNNSSSIHRRRRRGQRNWGLVWTLHVVHGRCVGKQWGEQVQEHISESPSRQACPFIKASGCVSQDPYLQLFHSHLHARRTHTF